MQTKQLIFRDTITNHLHVTKPVKVDNEFENENRFVFGARNLKKATIVTTKRYVHEQIDLYSINNNEIAYIFYITAYLSKDNILYSDRVPLSTSQLAKDMGTSTRNVQRTLKILVEKNVLRKVKLAGVKCYMLNPVFGCFRNSVSYLTYYVFMKEIDDFYRSINQAYRLENIKEHYEKNREIIERETEIL